MSGFELLMLGALAIALGSMGGKKTVTATDHVIDAPNPLWYVDKTVDLGPPAGAKAIETPDYGTQGTTTVSGYSVPDVGAPAFKEPTNIAFNPLKR